MKEKIPRPQIKSMPKRTDQDLRNTFKVIGLDGKPRGLEAAGALSIAHLAIRQLKRISDDDPKKMTALVNVGNWIDQQLDELYLLQATKPENI